jgi:hypothetical protein
MKTAKKIIIEDCKDPDTGEYPTWEEVEKHTSYDIYGTLRLMEMAQEVGQVDVGKLIDRYIKKNLPQANDSFHWQAEIKAGFNGFKEWYKSTQSIPEIGQSDIKKEKLNDLIDVEKRDTFTSEQNPSGDYDIHIPFVTKKGKKYRLVPMEQSDVKSKIVGTNYFAEDLIKEEIVDVLKKRVQNLIVSDLISPFFWEDFANEIIQLYSYQKEHTGQGDELFISDEEIENEADVHSSFKGVGGLKNNNLAKQVSFMQGAKWYREQIRNK